MVELLTFQTAHFPNSITQFDAHNLYFDHMIIADLYEMPEYL